MKFLNIQGRIKRRILLNYVLGPEVVAKLIPHPFKPKLIRGKAVAGICLISLSELRPHGFPLWMGLESENAAYRFAVEWEDKGEKKEGVYIARRETSSKLNQLAGGRVFPGIHFLSDFETSEENGVHEIRIKNNYGTRLHLKAKKAGSFPGHSHFQNIEEASGFFKTGTTGFSPNKTKLDAIELIIKNWETEALLVTKFNSEYFSNKLFFPKGSIQFDHALLMQNLVHCWKNVQEPETMN